MFLTHIKLTFYYLNNASQLLIKSDTYFSMFYIPFILLYNLYRGLYRLIF